MLCLPLRSITFLLYFCGSSAATLAFPMVGVLCYLLLYHVYPQTTWWGIALEPLAIRYTFVCALCLAIGTTLNLNRLKFGRRFIHPVEWGIICIFLAMLASTVTGLPWDAKTDFAFNKMWKVFLFTFILTHVVVGRRQVWLVACMLTLMALYLGHEAKNAPSGAFAENRLDGIGGPDFRESSGLAIHLFALLPFVAILLLQKSLWLKVLAFFAGCYSVNAILLCRARSAFVAGIIVGLLAVWYAPHRYRRWVVVALILAAIGGMILSDQWFWERMITIFSSEEERDTSAAGRLIIWEAAREVFKDYPLGVGIGQFPAIIVEYLPPGAKHRPDAHNTYILCAVEMGIPGLLAFLGTLVLAWVTLGQLNRRIKARLSDPDLFEMLIFASRLALLVYSIAGFFVSRLYTEGMWIFIVLPVCLTRAVENEIRVEAREEEKLRAILPALAARFAPA